MDHHVTTIILYKKSGSSRDYNKPEKEKWIIMWLQ